MLEPFLHENAVRSPRRTVAQLRELDDDIQNITGMTDQRENTDEKIALYLDHCDAIEDVTDAFDGRWEGFTDGWADRPGEVLEETDSDRPSFSTRI